MKKVIFMGTPLATIIFKKPIQSDYEIVGLFTQPDKKVEESKLLLHHILSNIVSMKI